MRTPLKFLVPLLPVACSALSVSAQTAVTEAATLSGGVALVVAGRAVSPPWFLTHTGGVSGAQFDLSYPLNKLSAGGFQRGDLSNNVALYWRQIAPGQQRVLFFTRDGSELDTNVNFGSLPVSLVAGDYQGGGRITITNAIVSRTNAVAALPLGLSPGGVFSAPVFHGDDGVVDLVLAVQSNHLWVVQASTNLVNWVNLATNFATLDYVVAKDLDAPRFPARFYRAR
jgi:hypothetical protein